MIVIMYGNIVDYNTFNIFCQVFFAIMCSDQLNVMACFHESLGNIIRTDRPAFRRGFEILMNVQDIQCIGTFRDILNYIH